MDEGRSLTLRASKKPKDISESLGKLPPSDLPMEELVLGAVMLEKSAIEKIPGLKAEHFYSEQHSQIFAAILGLAADHQPIDMRTVINRLKKNGKLELVGGHFYISELTSKVSSSQNIDAHSKVIMEMSIKREMIQLANKIHQTAYEDTTDAFELLEKTVDEWNYFKKYSVPENGEAKIKELWQKTLIDIEPPEDVTLVEYEGTPVVVEHNHTLIIGKKKSRKTLFIALLISKYLKNHRDCANKVLLFDTEQGKSHVWKVRKKIHQITGLWVPIFYLRGMSPPNRRDFITHTLKYWPSAATIAVVDGVRDCMYNINDPVETTDVLVWLEELITLHDVGLIEVLHANKTDGNARGHIGTELLNKAVCTVEMELDDKNNCTIVKCESARDKPFDTFFFTHDVDGLPIVVGTPVGGDIIPMGEKRQRLETIFEHGPLGYTELIDEVKAHFSVGISRAGQLLTEFQRQGWIVKNGKPKAAGTMYKLLVSSNGSNGYYPEEPPPTVQQEIFQDDNDSLPF